MDRGLIYDVGMNRGRDTAYYLHLGYRVVAVEANPLLAEAARRRFADAVDAGRLVVLAVGIGPERGEATFRVNERFDEWSAFSRDIAGRQGSACRPVVVPCVPFADLLAEHGVPHYLKIDIEGHDALCLDALSPDDLPTHLSVEAHGPAYLHRLRALGYDAFKCVNQMDHNDPTAQGPQRYGAWPRLRRNTRRIWKQLTTRVTSRPDLRVQGGPRRDGSWFFARGSSGPFGEDAPGPWRTLEAVEADLLELERALALPKAQRPRTALNPIGWHDIHATRRAP